METTLVVSDIHLGSPVCQCDKVLDVLFETPAKRVVVNGDLIDSHNLSRFRRKQWEVLSILRQLSKKREVIFVRGNHDGDMEKVSTILGLNFVDEYSWTQNGRRFLAIHGDQFDVWVRSRSKTTWFFTSLFYFLQRIDTHRQVMSRFVKLQSKILLKIDNSQKRGAATHAHRRGVDVILTGHSHMSCLETIKIGDREILYANSGSFTEEPCTYLTIDSAGQVQVHTVSNSLDNDLVHV